MGQDLILALQLLGPVGFLVGKLAQAWLRTSGKGEGGEEAVGFRAPGGAGVVRFDFISGSVVMRAGVTIAGSAGAVKRRV